MLKMKPYLITVVALSVSQPHVTHAAFVVCQTLLLTSLSQSIFYEKSECQVNGLLKWSQ